MQKHGYEIIKTYDVIVDGKVKLYPYLSFKTVIDIGANEGQFLHKLYKIYPDLNYISFEPLKEPFLKLYNFAQNKKNIHTFNVALGASKGSATIYHNSYSPSSSLLKMKNIHKEAFTYTKNEVEETIQVAPLDEIFNNHRDIFIPPYLVKIDVQGFEKQVLEGGAQFLKEVDSVIIELSIEQLYEGAPLFDEIYSILKSYGFRYCGNIDQLKDPNTGRFLQVDGLFRRIK